MSIVIRGAVEADIPAIHTLLNQLTSREPLTLEGARNRFVMIQRDTEQAMWLAADGEETVGLYTFRIRHNIERVSHYGEVSALVVAASHRRSGVGKMLIDHAEQFARSRACIGLWLVSGNHRRDEAHRFYASLGFESTGTRFVRHFA